MGNNTARLDISKSVAHLLTDEQMVLNLLERAIVRQALDHLDYFFLH